MSDEQTLVNMLRQWGSSTLDQSHAAVHFEAADALERVTAEVERLRADAERYRKACDMDADVPHLYWDGDDCILDKESADEALDSAIAIDAALEHK
jgi:hypothetical protein